MAQLSRISRLSPTNSERGEEMLALTLQNAFFRSLEENSGWELEPTNFTFLPAQELITFAYRALYGEYGAQNVNYNGVVADSLAFQGGYIRVDNSIQADADLGFVNVDGWLDKRLMKTYKKWIHDFMVAIFNGNPGVTPNAIRGLKTRLDGVATLAGSTETGVRTPGTGGYGSVSSALLNNPANNEAFIEMMLMCKDDLDDANAIFVNKSTYGRINTIGRAKGLIDFTTDLVDKRVTLFDGVPLVKVPDTVIPTNEPGPAGALNTTSIYIAQLGEGDLSLATNSGLDFYDLGELEGVEANACKWDFRAQPKIENENAIRRVRFIQLN